MRCDRILEGHTAAVLALAAMGPVVWSAGEDLMLMSWSVTDFVCVQSCNVGYRVNGLLRVGAHNIWASGQCNDIRVWDAQRCAFSWALGSGAWGQL